MQQLWTLLYQLPSNQRTRNSIRPRERRVTSSLTAAQWRHESQQQKNRTLLATEFTTTNESTVNRLNPVYQSNFVINKIFALLRNFWSRFFARRWEARNRGCCVYLTSRKISRTNYRARDSPSISRSSLLTPALHQLLIVAQTVNQQRDAGWVRNINRKKIHADLLTRNACKS